LLAKQATTRNYPAFKLNRIILRYIMVLHCGTPSILVKGSRDPSVKSQRHSLF